MKKITSYWLSIYDVDYSLTKPTSLARLQNFETRSTKINLFGTLLTINLRHDSSIDPMERWSYRSPTTIPEKDGKIGKETLVGVWSLSGTETPTGGRTIIFCPESKDDLDNIQKKNFGHINGLSWFRIDKPWKKFVADCKSLDPNCIVEQDVRPQATAKFGVRTFVSEKGTDQKQMDAENNKSTSAAASLRKKV